MLYAEPIPRKRWIVLAIAVAAALYLPYLGLHEFQSRVTVAGWATEAQHATVAREMAETGSFLQPTVHGQPVAVFPLYAWLVCVTSRFGVPDEWSTRLPAALAVLVLAGLSARMAAHARGHLAGAVAAVMCLSTVMTLDKGRLGEVNTVAAALLCAAWFSWYRLGRAFKRWGLAWVAGLACTLAAFFGIGIVAFAYFYFPLIFLRRPLSISRRFLVLPHLVALAAIGVVLFLWFRLMPQQTWLALAMPESTSTYVGHLVSFPLACAVALLPWTVVCWPPFCAAFRTVERTPIMCRYLRTVVLSLSLAIWWLPGSRPSWLLPALGPLAVLTGLYFDILLRRHYFWLKSWVPLLARTAVLLAGAGLGLFALHLTGIMVLTGATPWQVGGSLTLLCAALILGWYVRQRAQPRPYWIRLALVALALQCLFLSLMVPYRALYYERRRGQGEALAAQVPADTVVYKLYENDITGECAYLQRPVRQIASTGELPGSLRTVYVLAGSKAPILETRAWEPCSRPVSLRQRSQPRWRWRPPEGGLVRLDREWLAGEGEGPDGTVRMYRGTWRPVVGQIPGVGPGAIVPSTTRNQGTPP